MTARRCGVELNPLDGADNAEGGFCDETGTHRVTVDGVRQRHAPYDACAKHAQQYADAARRHLKHEARAVVTITPLE